MPERRSPGNIPFLALPLLLAACATTGSPLASPLPASSTRQSSYTRLDAAGCRLLEQNLDEAGYSRWLCPGQAGWSVELTESDLRQDLELIAPSGQRTPLELTRRVARGAFNDLGATAEWRGPSAARPDTLIVRMNVAQPEHPPRPDISRLAVIRLTAPPCLIAIVEPGAAQNERARAVADASTRTRCLG